MFSNHVVLAESSPAYNSNVTIIFLATINVQLSGRKGIEEVFTGSYNKTTGETNMETLDLVLCQLKTGFHSVT